MLPIAIPAGLLIGLSLGALGGGSILTVPVLVYLLHQSPHAATAGSLLVVGITAAGGMIAHQRARHAGHRGASHSDQPVLHQPGPRRLRQHRLRPPVTIASVRSSHVRHR